MNTANVSDYHKPEQVRQELIKVGVNEHFVAGLNEKAARDLLEGVKRLLEKRKEELT